MTENTFNPEARDGDGDGIVQEGTEFERPIDQLEVNPVEDAEPEEPVADATISEEVITATATGGTEEESVLAPVNNGTIGSVSRKKQPKPSAKKAAATESKLVAIFSNRNISWNGVGRVNKGYNFVSAADAEKWLTIEGVRSVDPTEVAQELK